MRNTDSILDQIGLMSMQSFEEQMSNEYNKMKEQYVIDRNGEYPDPEYLIEIGGVPTIPKGNVVALSAKWKNGKTFFCDVLTAIFLGCDQFAGCRSLKETGKVLFYDTEQAKSDTYRIRKTIDAMVPENRQGDYDVFCLRSVDIDKGEDSDEMTRFEIIQSGIVHEHPDLVIIDGIADLIYNYNDVYESQDVVNKLAAIANDNNCAIVVVMHQNKGRMDKNMKGHLGTMLYQKCSDVFNIEKHDTIFEVSHANSRHRQCNGLVFKLDANAVPMDAVADSQLQVELERQQNESKMREILLDIIPNDGSPVKRNTIADYLIENCPFKRAKAYDVITNEVKKGWLIAIDRSTVKLNTQKDG